MRQKIVVILFLLGIFGFGLASLIKEDIQFSETENRYLAKLPKPTVDSVFNGSFEQDYETYITDQFVLRDPMIGLKTYVDLSMGKKESNGVYLGKDGYLMEKFEYDTFESEQEEKNEEAICNFVSQYASFAEAGRLQVLLIPTSAQILEERLPEFAAPYNQEILFDRIKSNIPQAYVDIQQVLKKHSRENIYYKTDHHWTTLGACYGYEAWAKKAGIDSRTETDFQVKEVSNEFFGTLASKVNILLQPDTIQLYLPKEERKYQLEYDLGVKRGQSLYDMEALKGKDKYSVFLGGNFGMVDIKTEVENNKKLLLIKDSFAHSMVPFLAEHFSQLYVVDLRYYNASVKKLIEENDITDIMVLYNIANASTDRNVTKICK